MPHNVDIILPTCARPHTLPVAIRSVLEQTHRDFILHIVGDGCAEETVRTVEAITDPRVRMRSFAKAQGLAAANINVVLRETSADYIAYMSDDDLWYPDHLASAIGELERSGKNVVAFRPAAVLPDRGFDPFLFPFDWKFGLWRSWWRHQFVGLESFVHRRSALAEIGFWNETLSRFADFDYYRRLRSSSAGGDFVDRITVLRFYNRHWSGRYRSGHEPPQLEYLERLRNAAWRDASRLAVESTTRTWGVRARQLQEFARMAIHSGAPFLRRRIREWGGG